jgi:CBS domain-containing protein
MILVMMVFVLVVGAVMGAYLAFTKLPGILAQRKLDARLAEVTSTEDKTATDAAELVKEQQKGFLPVIDRFTAQTEKGLAFTTWVEQSGARISVSGLLLIARSKRRSPRRSISCRAR